MIAGPAIARPTVNVSGVNGKARIAPSSSQLSAGAAVATGSNSKVRLSFGIGSIVIYQRSVLKVKKLAVTKRGGYFYDFQLSAGTARMSKGRFNNSSSAAKLTTSGGTYWLKGTKLMLSSYGGIDFLIVTEGAVRACFSDLHKDCGNPDGDDGVLVEAGQLLYRDIVDEGVTTAPVIRDVSRDGEQITLWFAPGLEVWGDARQVSLAENTAPFTVQGGEIRLTLRFPGQAQGRTVVIKLADN